LRTWSDIPSLVRLSRRVLAPGTTPLRIGWLTAFGLTGQTATFASFEPALAMRISNLARWMNAHARDVVNEVYRPGNTYDVVVVVKAMDDATSAEAERLQAAGTKVVFDANVNYYEVWGEYDVPGTRPTDEQSAQAIAMTTMADWVVADSSYLLSMVERHTDRASWIPDNVNLRLFGRARRHEQRPGLRLVWSGIAKKARPLLAIADALASLRDAELVLSSEAEPDVAEELRAAIPTRFVPFELGSYAKLLRTCDVIISPKRLTNGYEVGHSEWKITLGMACGLPAVASPQQSYVEAIGALGGGIVADTEAEWLEALARLEDPAVRSDLGERARRTVRERYATPVVARLYLELLRGLA
jgi:glycosyltransferase involved in cell wall biosynthesis